MGFEASQSTKMQSLTCQDSSLKPLNSSEVFPGHKRSKSYPDRMKEDGLGISPKAHLCLKLDMGQVNDDSDVNKKQSPTTELQSSLKQEILQLEKRLQDQFVERSALEKALGYKALSHDTFNEASMPKPTKELIKEIAVLELEVTYLEQYLLSLYRKVFGQQIAARLPSAIDERFKSPSVCKTGLFPEFSGVDVTPNPAVEPSRLLSPQNSLTNPMKVNAIGSGEMLKDPGVHRSYSSLSHRSVCSTRTSPPMEKLAKSIRACHSQPLSMMEHAMNSNSNLISLAEHLGTRIADHVPETPNRLSEEMVRCMAAIYCKLADPPLPHHGLSSSPTSSSSSMSAFSVQDQCDIWSPHCKKESSFDSRLENPFQVEGLSGFIGHYNTMVEVRWICRDSQRLSSIEHLLHDFRSFVCRLEKVDLRNMKHEEKLAFWINIHNVLVMHGYLSYGIPQNNLKRVSFLFKAAYNVGGCTISADAIQNSILRCHTHRPGQWLRILFSPKSKFKSGDKQQAYAIEHSEPLLHFALCSGSLSDPAVRVYTPKRVFQELEAAKEEYIQATVGIRKEQKIFLPKIIESFAKDSGVSSVAVLDMIQYYLPETVRMAMQRCQQGRSRKSFEWVPHNFAFRYLFLKELAK